MNKLKLIYDVVTTLKDKESLTGTLSLEAKKDQAKCFGLESAFEKNLITGHTKAKVSTEANCGEEKLKHESTTEFTGNCCCKEGHHHFLKHMHGKNCCMDKKNCGFKSKLSLIACALSLFNAIKMEEQEDKSYTLSLNLNDLPEDIKSMVKNHHCQAIGDKECCFMKEHEIKDIEKAQLSVKINNNHEVEKISLSASGKALDKDQKEFEVELNASLVLKW